MKYFLSDLIKLSLTFIAWYSLLTFFYTEKYFQAYESIKYFPFHLVVTIGYYAIVSVCYKILFIRDCEKEYDELISEIDLGRNFFTKNNIKYN